MSTRRTKQSRKRKQPDTFKDDTSEPRSKRRKLSHTHNKRNAKKSDDKSQSASPKIHNHSPNPFKNIKVPIATAIHKKASKPKSKPMRRHSQYMCRQTDNNKNDTDSDSDNEDDDITSPETESSDIHNIHRIPLKHSTIRSQPSTPLRKINIDRTVAPQSQSAKRSKIQKKYPYINCNNNNNNNNNNNKLSLSPISRDSSSTPPPPISKHDRKAMPVLFSSQDSLQFSPPQMLSPKKRIYMHPHMVTPKRSITNNINNIHIIPINATPIRTNHTTQYMQSNYKQHTVNNNTNNSNNTNENDNNRYDNDILSENIYNDRRNILYMFLFILLGFMAGVVVAVSGYHENELRNPKIATSDGHGNYNDYHIVNDVCTCDTTTNTTSKQCSPCMDEYWKLKSKCDTQQQQYVQIKRERDALKTEKQRLEAELNCRVELTNIKEKNSKCESDKRDLDNEIVRLKKVLRDNDDNDDNDDNLARECKGYRARVGQLEHELGECNVEWGSCEQLGRQKDKLDEKRLEKIQKQKAKFTLCNEQLKRYKDAAKKNKANKY